MRESPLRRHGGDRRDQKGVVGCGHQDPLAFPLAEKIKEHADNEESNREVNQYDMLRVLCEEYRTNVERMQGFS
jgi:predicted small lipoprotein YifL